MIPLPTVPAITLRKLSGRSGACFAFLCLFALAAGPSGPSVAPGADAPTPTFAKDIRPLLEAHCFKCHDAEKKKAGINLTAYTDEKSILRKRKTWRKVITQLETLEMPPAKEPQLGREQRDHLVAWIKQTLNTIDCTNLAERNPGRSVIRRLNRTEYNRTLHDLIGIEFDSGAAVGMPDEAGGLGFDNLANALILPPALMDKYFAAADRVLEQVLPAADAPPKRVDAATKKRLQQAHDALVFVKPGADLPRRDAARKIMAQFLRRAYRRPVQDTDVDRYLKLFDRAEGKGADFEASVRLMVKAALVSPHFLFRIEQDQAAKGSEQGYRVSDHELAVRLSYFLWSTMPDAELFTLAEQKKLSDPAELEKQVKRMLADPKGRALTDYFAVQWLQLRKLEFARPSTDYFPTFTRTLRRAMHDETATFFDKLRTDDRSILELLDADYTYVNEELARHYKLEGVKGPEMRRVELKPGDHRGGLLGMGSILALTSHTSRTSPTMRGKWVVEVVFGTPPPPPPPDAGMLKEGRKKGEAPKTLRELLAQHATQPSCAACHRKIDPLGFALDSYDAVGRWRQDNGGEPIDTAGRLPTGEKFNGPQELKQVLLKNSDAFTRNLAEQLLVYALGRDLQYYDECAIRDVTAALKKNDQRFSALVLGIVKSYPFLHRRNTDAGGEE
jgi:hypothetical protein